MPERRLRPGIITSDKVDQLDFAAEVFYRRLMSVVDDYGLHDGRALVLRTALYPLRIDRIRDADISRWVAMCAKAGLIATYEVEGKPYLELHNLCEPRTLAPKCPPPPWFPEDVKRAYALKRAQVRADSPPSPSSSSAPSGIPPKAPQGGLSAQKGRGKRGPTSREKFDAHIDASAEKMKAEENGKVPA